MRRFHWTDNERKWVRHILKRRQTVVNGNYVISMCRKRMYRGRTFHSLTVAETVLYFNKQTVILCLKQI